MLQQNFVHITNFATIIYYELVNTPALCVRLYFVQYFKTGRRKFYAEQTF